LTRLKSELILFFVATLWAFTFPIIKISLTEFPPFYFVGIRFLAAAILFTLIFYKRISGFNKDSIIAGLVLGILLELGFASQSYGLVYTSSSSSALITGVNVLIVPFAQYLILRKRVRMENWIGVIVVTLGLFMLTRPFQSGINIGDAVTLICSVSWAFYIVSLDVYTNKYNVYVLLFIQFWLVSVISFSMGVLTEDSAKIILSTPNILTLLYLSVFATLIASTLGNKYQKFTTPIRATLVLTWEQPAAVFFSIILINEKFTSLQILGGIIMIMGILFSETFEYIKKLLNRNSTESI